MGWFNRKSDYTPSDNEVRDAAQKLQQGGVRGRGTRRQAERLTRKSGSQADATAGRIMSAAAEYEPKG